RLLIGLDALAIARPVERGTIVAGGVLLPEPGRRMEWLVGIERLDLQEPVVLGVVQIEELEGAGKAAVGREILLLLDALAVDQVLETMAGAFLALDDHRVVAAPELIHRRPHQR